MDKRNFISVTLLVSALAFNPLIAQEINRVNTSKQIDRNTVSSNIASILHKRGLDEDAAKEISENLVNEEDELFAMMIGNLITECGSLSKNEILEYLSKAALHRQNINFDSYSELVSMVSRIQQKVLDKKMLNQLSIVAKRNAYYVKSYRLNKEEAFMV